MRHFEKAEISCWLARKRHTSRTQLIVKASIHRSTEEKVCDRPLFGLKALSTTIVIDINDLPVISPIVPCRCTKDLGIDSPSTAGQSAFCFSEFLGQHLLDAVAEAGWQLESLLVG